MKQDPTTFIKRKAKSLGFLSCGISQAAFLEEEATKLENWLNDGRHGQMKYMENHFDMRLDPRKLVPGAKSVISLSYNYFNDNFQKDKDAGGKREPKELTGFCTLKNMVCRRNNISARLGSSLLGF